MAFYTLIAVGELPPARPRKLIAKILDRFPEDPLIREGALSALAGNEMDFLTYGSGSPDWKKPGPGKAMTIQAVASINNRLG